MRCHSKSCPSDYEHGMTSAPWADIIFPHLQP
uniref:Uncharacterized protein n=1 Tax=Anguilla anguilla TaxID=7936 RepID=A0A0E9R153_ANGAN